MDTRDDSYFALSSDGSWIDRLRVRLPYSFERIEVKPDSGGRAFVLSDPTLREGAFSATCHSFWRRGHVFYMVGKLLDCHSMASIWQNYRMRIGMLRLRHPADPLGSTAFSAFDFYNSMQLQKVWGFALANHLDRERVMMTNLAQALELCLKAMTTHAGYLETGRFEFPAGHRIPDLYHGLPDPLRDEIAQESRAFADSYASYRAGIESDVRTMSDQLGNALSSARALRDERAQWEDVAARLNDSDYTAFLNSNDPGASLNARRDDWLDDALGHIGQTHGFGDELQYYRYAPAENTDDLPTEPINLMLLLGRFLYEHLFPMPTDPEAAIRTELLE
ncbi:MAG: hypothetical protein OXH86_07040 [Acidimicrobiaceae bacterium]|nr:hypothetical protein [Acidimicrobiaceae bacterium]